jgi:hypothetical protein
VSSIRHRSEKLKHRGVRGERGESVRPVLVVGGPSEEPVTAAKSRPNPAAVAHSPSSVFFTVSVQNEFLLLCRLRRMKSHRKWCTIARAWALPSLVHGVPVALFGRAELRMKERPELSDVGWTIEIRTKITLHFN